MTSRYLSAGLGLTVLIGGLFWYTVGWAPTTPAIATAWLIGANTVTFGFFGLDKRRAVLQGRRVPEAALLTLAAVGGSLGAFAGMGFFRHKTLKGSFRTLFWLIVSVQVVLAAWLVRWAYWAG